MVFLWLEWVVPINCWYHWYIEATFPNRMGLFHFLRQRAKDRWWTPDISPTPAEHLLLPRPRKEAPGPWGREAKDVPKSPKFMVIQSKPMVIQPKPMVIQAIYMVIQVQNQGKNPGNHWANQESEKAKQAFHRSTTAKIMSFAEENKTRRYISNRKG